MAGTASPTSDDLRREVQALRDRLAQAEQQLTEAQELIQAIQTGEVDAVIVDGPQGNQVFTLQHAEYSYRALVEAMNEGAATLAADGTVLYANERLAELAGISLEQIIGSPASNLVATATRPAFEQLFALASTGESARAELELAPANGTRRVPVYLSLREMRTGGLNALCMVATDLTERNRRDQIIKAERQRLFDVLEALPPMICLLTPDHHVSFANRAFREKFGDTPGRHCYEHCFQLAEPCTFCEAFEVLKTGKPHKWEVTCADGTVISAYNFPFTDVDGSPLILEMAEDITERRRAETELQAHREHLASLVDERTAQLAAINAELQQDIAARQHVEEQLRITTERFEVALKGSPIVVFNQDLDLRYTWIYNPALGYSAFEVIGKTDTEIFERVEDGLVTQEIKTEVIRTGERRRREVVVHWRGVDHYYDLQVFPLRDANGRIAGVTCATMDITERKQSEFALLQSEKLASVGRLAATIAHEINNPLETIGQALYLIGKEAALAAQSRSLLDLAVQEMDRVAHICQEALAFHRGNRTPAPIDPRECVEGVQRLFAARMQTRGVVIQQEYADACRVTAVSSEIRQIISNLLSNSLDAMPGPGRLRIRIARSSARQGRPGVRLTVADTGTGITPERLKQIFRPFFTTKEVVGTGLGLWVTKQIAEKCGANIRVRSKVGKGSVFSILFPAAEESSEAQ